MKNNLQKDNPIQINSVKEREKAIAALDKAKAIPRKVVFLPKGASRDFKPVNRK